METINLTKEIKTQFEKERFNLRTKENRIIKQNEFIMILLKQWRMR